jgi:hypothetical protein
MRPLHFALALGLLAAGCERHHITLDANQVLGSGAGTRAPQLHVTCALEGSASDPLPIAGADIDLLGVQRTIEDVVTSELKGWAARSSRKGGWELSLELFDARGSQSHDRVTAELSVRATLSSTIGEINASQTRRDCKETAPHADAALYACIQSLAHDLSGWIEGVQP